MMETNVEAPEVRHATHLLSLGMELGEGPIWIGDALWFVDIKGRSIFRLRPGAESPDRWSAPEFVGWIVPAEDGAMIVGLRSGPARFLPASGVFEPLAAVDAQFPSNRLNDAAVHPSGTIYFGTMDNDETQASGRLFTLDRGVVGSTRVEPVVITNGPAIAPAGDRLYHVDTLARRITAHAIGPDGKVGESEEFLRFTGDEGHPDGAVCDAAGGLWIGFYGGWAARRFDAAGRMTDEVRFPVANVTKVAIGGPDGRTAYATTARQGLSVDELRQQPLAGDLFSFPVKVGAPPLALARS